MINKVESPAGARQQKERAGTWKTASRKRTGAVKLVPGFSTESVLKLVEFKANFPGAARVFVAGSFNGWAALQMPLMKNEEGQWHLKTMLPPGRHEYKYLVDGEWVEDSKAELSVENAFGTRNSVLEVK